MLKSWLSIIARTKAIDRCREIAKTRTISLESTILVSDLGIVDDMIQEETRRVLIAAVNALGDLTVKFWCDDTITNRSQKKLLLR